jgi:hypothetical protein
LREPGELKEPVVQKVPSIEQPKQKCKGKMTIALGNTEQGKVRHLIEYPFFQFLIGAGNNILF